MEISHFTYQNYCLSIGIEKNDDFSYSYFFCFKRPEDRMNILFARRKLVEIKNCPPPCSRAGTIFESTPNLNKVIDKIRNDHYKYIPDSYKDIFMYLTYDKISEINHD